MQIDLNADLAEGYGQWRIGDDEALLDILSSANLACGFHAGDPLIMERTVKAALGTRVSISARMLASRTSKASDVDRCRSKPKSSQQW